MVESILNTNDSFLKVYPWDNSVSQGKKTLDYVWEFDLAAPLEDLWEQLIDTSSFNERMGLPPMQYEEKNGRLYGRTKNAGFTLEWEEVPWEWEYCKTLNNARVYSRGFAKYVRSRYLFYPIQNNLTKLVVYFGWIPRHKIGSMVLKIGMPKIQKDYQKVLQSITVEINNRNRIIDISSRKAEEKDPQYLLIQPNLPATDGDSKTLSGSDSTKILIEEKIKEIGKKLILEGCDSSILSKFIKKITTDSDNELYRIQIKKLSEEWNTDYKEILKIALYGCKHGLLTLSWDLICPHCRGVRNELKHLGEIPEDANCDVCDIDFSTSQKNSVEITFHVHPSIRNVQKRYFCAAEPATKKHIYFQKIISPNDNHITNLRLESGIYRLRSGNNKSYSLLEIPSNHESNLEQGKTSDGEPLLLDWRSDLQEDIISNSNHISLRLSNPTESPLPFIIESKKEDKYALRPGDLLNYKEFKNLFSEEYIGTGITLDIGVQTILFTDIVGSTQLYFNHGDSKAFTEVRKHFVELYRIIEENDGVVVKTIGDSVMASFSDPPKALDASLEIQEFFQNPTNADLLKIRISIHTGTCLAVNFNNGIDYFGNTVNYASKLQKYSQKGDIVFSEEFFELKQVKNSLRSIQDKFRIKRFRFQEKWDPSTTRSAYKINIP